MQICVFRYFSDSLSNLARILRIIESYHPGIFTIQLQMKVIALLFTFLLVFPTLLAASTKYEADSMKAITLAMPNDSNKVKALTDLAFMYRNFSPKETIFFAKNAFDLAKSIDYQWGVPRAVNFIGVGHQKLGEQAMALEYYSKAKNFSLKTHNIEQLAYSYHNMGTIYNWQNDYEKSIELFYKSLKIFEQLKDLQGIAYVNNSLSQAALSEGDLELALQHANKTLEVRKQINDVRGQGGAYNRIGEIYIQQHKYDKALTYFFKNIKLYAELEDYEGLAFTNINIGRAYIASKDYTKAVYFSKKGFEYYHRIGNNGVVSEALLLVAQASFKMGEIERSMKYCEKSIVFAKEYNRQEVLANAYLLLSNIYEKQRKFNDALLYHQEYVTLKDSLFSQEVYHKAGWEQGSFAIFKKEQENALLKEKEAVSAALIQKQQILQWSLIAGLLLFSAFVGLLIRSNRNRERDNTLLQLKNKEIEAQKEAITNQSIDLANAQKQLKDYNIDLERKVEERTEALKKSNEELELYAYLASHDLKQPLRNIAGFTQLIIRDLTKKNLMDATIKEYSTFIVDSTQYMHHLIEDLLTFSKFSTNSHDVTFETVTYREVIDSVLQNLHQQIQDKNANIVVLNIPISGEGLKIKLMQLFQNLISNALKFSKKDTPAIICIDSQDLGTHYQFSIADNGIGIKKEYFALIFETFKKLHNKQEYAGVGLGLSTCKKIVEQHKGEIWLESELDKGTIFHFTIAKRHL